MGSFKYGDKVRYGERGTVYTYIAANPLLTDKTIIVDEDGYACNTDPRQLSPYVEKITVTVTIPRDEASRWVGLVEDNPGGFLPAVVTVREAMREALKS